jgi:hypothetical protein
LILRLRMPFFCLKKTLSTRMSLHFHVSTYRRHGTGSKPQQVVVPTGGGQRLDCSGDCRASAQEQCGLYGVTGRERVVHRVEGPISEFVAASGMSCATGRVRCHSCLSGSTQANGAWQVAVAEQATSRARRSKQRFPVSALLPYYYL